MAPITNRLLDGITVVLSITGSPDDSAKAGCSIADIAAGMYVYICILSALLQRGKTGKGSRIDVSMLESMVEWMSYALFASNSRRVAARQVLQMHFTPTYCSWLNQIEKWSSRIERDVNTCCAFTS